MVQDKTSPATSLSPRVEQEFLRVLSDAEDKREQATVLTEVLQGVDDPWLWLDRLSDADFSKNYLRMAVAIVLSSEWTEQQIDSANHWLHWLAREAWEQRRFMEVAILCSAYPEICSSEVPSELIATLAAARSIEDPEPALSMLSCRENMTEGEKFVVAAIALVEIILRGSRVAITALEDKDKVLPSTMKKLAQAVESYWRKTYKAFPVENIRAEVNATRYHKDRAHDWIMLENALDEGARVNFKFRSGTKTHEYLHHKHGPMGQLRSLVVQRNTIGVAEWLEGIVMDDPGAFLDNATQAATGRNDQYFERGKRRSYIKMLETIIDLARKVAEPTLLMATEEKSWQMELARPIAKMLHKNWNKIRQEMNTIDSPNHTLLETLLDDIQFIADWGAE